MRKFINPSLSPNLEKADVLSSVKLLFSPWLLKSGVYISEVEAWFRSFYSMKYAYTFSSARECEYALFCALGIGKGDEVLVQAFTCVAVISPILWIEAKPIYVDIDTETLSMDISDLEKKITTRTKAIIVQHTFGIPAQIEKIREIARKNNIFLLEDCAHVIGGYYNEKKLGEWGDAAFFSFGRDKAISSVFGGIIITNNKKVAEKIKEIQDTSAYPSSLWIYQQLLHPLLTYFVIVCFNLFPFLGRSMLFVFKQAHLISRPITSGENETFYGKKKINKYPNALAKLCISQLERLGRFNNNRVNVFKLYKKELRGLDLHLPDIEACYLRIPIMVSEREKLLLFCKKNSIYLGDWYSNVIDPKDTDFKQIHYENGTCKVAEEVANKIVNLPSHPSMDQNDARKVVALLKQYYEKEK